MWSTVSAAFGRALRKAVHGTIGYPLPIARYQFSLNAPSSVGASVTMVACRLASDDCQRNRDVRVTSTNRHPERGVSGPKTCTNPEVGLDPHLHCRFCILIEHRQLNCSKSASLVIREHKRT
jgi:hypothetical protein